MIIISHPAQENKYFNYGGNDENRLKFDKSNLGKYA